MTWLDAMFWTNAGFVLYPYALYPLALDWLARRKEREAARARAAGDNQASGARRLPSVSIVLAAYNEEERIGRRIVELIDRVEALGVAGEMIVVSDGSTDATVARARASAGPRSEVQLRVVELAENGGKSAALTRGCALARHEIVVFADARQTWAVDALERLLENFDDPGVGAVSGELIAESAPGVMAGVGLYWRYETWLRRRESRVFSAVGVTGAISAVRRVRFHPIPAGTILDDVYWPLRVAMQNARVVHDPRARAFDRLPDRVKDEFRRKVRTLSGNYQLLRRLPEAVNPARNPVWLQFLSHKIARLVVPWSLIVLLVLSLVLPGPVYRAALWCQLGFYATGLTGMVPALARRLRFSSAAASFLVLNAAAWIAFWVWASGRTDKTWTKTAYAWTSRERAAP